MIKALNFLLALLFLYACNSPKSNQENLAHLASNNDAQAKRKPLNPKEILGYYIKSAHDGAWLLQLVQTDTAIQGSLLHYHGMLPPPDFLGTDGAEEDIKEKINISEFELDVQTGKFRSNIGAGIISAKGIEFLEIMDLDVPLKLVRDPLYISP